MNKLFLVLVLFFVAGWAGEEKTYGSLHVFEVVKVYDGDTFFANVNGVHPLIGDNIGIRLRGIDTPELWKLETYLKKGKTAADSARLKEVYEISLKAKAFLDSSFQAGKKIILRDVARPKFFRILATVVVNGVDLNQEMVKRGLAKAYDGKKKISWW